MDAQFENVIAKIALVLVVTTLMVLLPGEGLSCV
jgi:hypothetical protein